MLNKHRQSVDLYPDEKQAIDSLLADLRNKSNRFIALSKLMRCLLNDACNADRNELLRKLSCFV